MKDASWTATSGVVLNPNFETYKLPGLADVPEIEIVLLNMPERGVIGIGEPVTIPTAAAIANAVANALGVRVPSLPITPQSPGGARQSLNFTPHESFSLRHRPFARQRPRTGRRRRRLPRRRQ